MKNWDALQKYIEHSEKREIIPGKFYARMSKYIAKNFDSGLYDFMLNEHKKCILELETLNIKNPKNAKFYIYIVPDENFIELMNFPHVNQGLTGGGMPVPSFDTDSFGWAYATTQNLLTEKERYIKNYIILLHEYTHILDDEVTGNATVFTEGFAELIPWYALGYEKYVSLHLEKMKNMKKIYSIRDLIGYWTLPYESFKEKCNYQPSYISAYLWTRAVVEMMRKKYNLSRIEAVKRYMYFFPNNTKNYNKWYVDDLAKDLNIDAEKLFYSTDYQMEELKKIEKEIEMNKIVKTKEYNQ